MFTDIIPTMYIEVQKWEFCVFLPANPKPCGKSTKSIKINSKSTQHFHMYVHYSNDSNAYCLRGVLITSKCVHSSTDSSSSLSDFGVGWDALLAIAAATAGGGGGGALGLVRFGNGTVQEFIWLKHFFPDPDLPGLPQCVMCVFRILILIFWVHSTTR